MSEQGQDGYGTRSVPPIRTTLEARHIGLGAHKPPAKRLEAEHPTACEGHVGTTEESYSRLVGRYEGNPIGFVAELSKKNQERKLMHEILNSAGVPAANSQGRELCLIARVAILAEQVKP